MKTSKLRKPGLVLLVIGVVLLWFSGKDFLTSLKAPVDLNEAGFTADQVEEGMHVKTDIYAALDTFASEETWTENKDGSSTPKRRLINIILSPWAKWSIWPWRSALPAANFPPCPPSWMRRMPT